MKNVRNGTTANNTPLFGEHTRAKGGGLAFTLSSLLPTVFMFVALIFLALFGLAQEGYNEADWYLYLSYLMPQIASACIAIYYLRYTKISVKKAIFAQKCAPKYLLLGFLLQFGLLSLSELNGLFISALQGLGYTPTPVTLPSVEGFGFVGVFLVIAIGAPLMEEIVFRGVILDGLQSGFSMLISALLCGAMFSLYHQNPVQTAYQFCCGVAYALLAVRAGSVLPTVLAHFLNNAYILILYKCGVETLPMAVYIPLMIVSALCFVGTLIYLFAFDKGIEPVADKGEQKTARKQFFLFALVGIIVCAFTWIASLFA